MKDDSVVKMNLSDNNPAVSESGKTHFRSFIININELHEVWNHPLQEDGADAYRREVIGQVFETGKPHVYEGKIGARPNGFAVFPLWNDYGEIDSVAVFEPNTVTPESAIATEPSNSSQKEKKSLSKLYSVIAHDLRSPFASIMGMSELLKDSSCQMETDEIKKYASIINQTASSSLQLLDKLLEWGKIQQGKVNPEICRLPLYEIADDTIEFFKATAAVKHIQLVNRVPKDTVINGDENMLRAILRNLVCNAIKYTGFGGEVIISTLLNQETKVISVKDTGIGLGPERLSKLFSNKSIESTKGTANEEGTGFGLMLCRDYIEMMNGKIWAESESGKGSVFSFSLPEEEW
jgi:signal transduction histidine kinase